MIYICICQNLVTATPTLTLYLICANCINLVTTVLLHCYTVACQIFPRLLRTNCINLVITAPLHYYIADRFMSGIYAPLHPCQLYQSYYHCSAELLTAIRQVFTYSLRASYINFVTVVHQIFTLSLCLCQLH